MENKKSIPELLNLILGAAEGGDQAALYRISQYAVKALNLVKEQRSVAQHPGAVWVKASEFKTHKPVYRPYRKPAMEDEGEWQLPSTDRYWDHGTNLEPMSYEAAYGSNGARDYMKNIAAEALKGKEGEKEVKP